MRSLGQRIKQVRNKRGWTLEQIEEKGYRSMRHWQQLESGSRNISFIILLRVSKTLQISLSELFKEI
jgi:XRE family transcriptional regulator, aerobic/anaerobic benzoate catabolism transcriptional regulator